MSKTKAIRAFNQLSATDKLLAVYHFNRPGNMNAPHQNYKSSQWSRNMGLFREAGLGEYGSFRHVVPRGTLLWYPYFRRILAAMALDGYEVQDVLDLLEKDRDFPYERKA